jgi:hypothetical protein
MAPEETTEEHHDYEDLAMEAIQSGDTASAQVFAILALATSIEVAGLTMAHADDEPELDAGTDETP